METRYIHATDVHNTQAPSIIVPKLIELFAPKSVVDFGCGIGTFLNIFIREGVTDVLGLDGAWVNRTLLNECIPENKFKAVNLETPISLNRKYDLAISLEVAEHLDESKSSVMVENLVHASDLIVFSAAIPYQGGQNHINEQWPTYWLELFSQHGYTMHDILRPLFWNNEDIFFWYKQNMFVLVKEGSIAESVVKKALESSPNTIYSIVHPDLYQTKNMEIADAQKQIIKYEEELKKITSGERGLRFYLRLVKKHIISKSFRRISKAILKP